MQNKVADKLQEIDKKVSELAGEVRFNENLLLRAETVLSELAELNAECKSRNDVQDERIVRLLEELNHNHSDIDDLKKETIRYHGEVLHAIKELEIKQSDRFSKIEDRVGQLENWRWFLLGAIAIISFLSQYLDKISFN